MKKAFLSLSFFLLSFFVQGQVPVMVKDVVPGAAGIGYYLLYEGAANAQKILVAEDAFYFYAIDRAGKISFLRSDGTNKGTYALAEAPYSRMLEGMLTSVETIPAATVGTTVYFSWHDPAHGMELWRTDGTKGGTALFLDLMAGKGDSSPANLIELNNSLLFSAYAVSDTLYSRRILYKTDGTAGGTIPIKKFRSDYQGLQSVTRLNNHVYFWAQEHPKYGLWRTDGSTEGTSFLADANPIIVSANGSIYFVGANNTLWKTKGTVESTMLLKDLDTGVGTSYPHQFTSAGGKLFFLAHAKRDSITLHGTEGTPSGTGPVGERYHNDGWSLIPFKNRLFYTSLGSSIKSTLGAASILHAKVPASDVRLLAATETELYFSALSQQTGTDLWQTDGTQAGTKRIANIKPGMGHYQNPSDGFIFKGEVYYLADDGIHGKELWKIAQAESVLSGNVFLDSNKNGVLDAGETGLKNQSIHVTPGDLTLYTTQDGTFKLLADPGTYTLTLTPSSQDWQLSGGQSSYTLTIPGNGVANFGLSPITEINRVNTTLTSSSPSRCGFDVVYWLDYSNTGTRSANGNLKLYADAQATFIESNPAPTTHMDGSLNWMFQSLSPTQQGRIMVKFRMPDFNSTGDTLRFITHTLLSATNETLKDTLEQVITCSWDPNDKQVIPAGIEENHLTLKDSWLDYTIRFQNTGTDTAFTVVLRDTLDLNLDLKTLVLLSSSHNMQLSRKDRALEFRFDDILLPDSTRNEPSSHGFVRYRIKANVGVAENTQVENTAHIFFDFNPAIETNTTLNTLVTSLPKREVTGLPKENEKIQVFPNPTRSSLNIRSNTPFTALSIYNSLGKRKWYSYYQSGSTTQTISLEQLPAGLYQIHIKTGNQTIRHKIVKQ